jgi:hypothetical protein
LELCATICHISPMALYRLVCALGQHSLVGVLLKCLWGKITYTPNMPEARVPEPHQQRAPCVPLLVAWPHGSRQTPVDGGLRPGP